LHQVPAGLKSRIEAAFELTDTTFNILAVDDEAILLEIYKDILESTHLGSLFLSGPASAENRTAPRFKVTCRTNAQGALEEVERSFETGTAFSAIFMDVNMPPGPSGIWAAEKILKIDPAANIVLVTGYIGSDSDNLPRHLNFCDRLLFLQKPFHPQEIVQCASALSAKWQAEQRLLSLNVELENMVHQRTEALLRSNEQLRREVDHRRNVQRELQQSLDHLKKIIGGSVMAIAMTVEKRDPYTYGHQQRVAELAGAIGREIGLSADQVEGLAIASAIHDIGKISLPAEILTKPSHLNNLEMSLIQAHSQAGYDILKSVDFPWPVAQIVLQHHERLNGTGYPQGLSGDKILKEARIVGVADVVETMSSHRPYRPSRGLDKALEEISAKKGILYDPDAVDACLALIGEKHFEFSCPVFA
jgi:HD-GYP domain-containing protein (c-di-GMP phosphodiesterase class II)